MIATRCSYIKGMIASNNCIILLQWGFVCNSSSLLCIHIAPCFSHHNPCLCLHTAPCHHYILLFTLVHVAGTHKLVFMFLLFTPSKLCKRSLPKHAKTLHVNKYKSPSIQIQYKLKTTTSTTMTNIENCFESCIYIEISLVIVHLDQQSKYKLKSKYSGVMLRSWMIIIPQ